MIIWILILSCQVWIQSLFLHIPSTWHGQDSIEHELWKIITNSQSFQKNFNSTCYAFLLIFVRRFIKNNNSISILGLQPLRWQILHPLPYWQTFQPQNIHHWYMMAELKRMGCKAVLSEVCKISKDLGGTCESLH